MNDKFGKFAWKIWVPIAGAVVLLVILLAALIPRPVPCETHFANVTSVTPSSICPSADALNVTVFGNGFLDIEGKLPVVTIDDAQVAFTLGDCEDLQIYRRPNVYDCHSINIAVPVQDPTNAAPRKIKIVNADPCNSSAEVTLDVSSSINTLVLFADPPVIYQNASIQVTLYTSGLNSTVEALNFRNSATGELFNMTGNIVSYGTTFNELLVEIEPLELPEGTYDIIVESKFDISGCYGLLRSGLIVRAQAGILIQSVDPSFIWIDATSASITVVAANSGDQFQPIPRAYLSRSGANAIALRGVSYISGQSITASVDTAKISVGPYDLIVVNPLPDSQVGVLRGAIVVTEQPPPVITSISPDGLVSGQSSNTQLNGANFDNVTAVQLTCSNIFGTTNGQFSATINSQSETSVDIDVPLNSIYALTGGGKSVVCTVTVVNSDGSFARFTGFSVKGSAMNLDDFSATSSMTSSRRAAALIIGQPSTSTRVLYAIGGDTETGVTYTDAVPSAYSTIDAAPLDIFGKLGTWREQRNQLPTPCAFTSAATVSQYVYVQCGNNGTSPTSAVYRAHILNPLATPSVSADTSFVRDETAGATFNQGGAFLYRVSAVFADDDSINPGGESLPGDIFTIYLPSGLNAELGNFHVNLTWDAIPDAIAYRVYRTVNGSSSEFGLLAQVSTIYHEDLSGDVDSSVTPLPPLSLGVWHAVLSLNSARAWGNMLSTAKPSTADQFFIFSFGGLSDAATPLATYDYTTVTVSPAASAKGRENQTMSAWITGGNSLATARYGHSSVTLTNEFVTQVPADTTQIYIGGGRITGNSFSQVIETAELSADGELTFADTTNSDNGPLARAGYCMFVYKTTSGQIGFTGGASSAQGKAGSFTDVAVFGSSWNAGWSGTNLNLISCVKLRPFVFIAGGTDGTTASAQTLYNIV